MLHAKLLVLIVLGITCLFLVVVSYLYLDISTLDQTLQGIAASRFTATGIEDPSSAREIEILVINKFDFEIAIYYADGDAGMYLVSLMPNEESTLEAYTGQQFFATNIGDGSHVTNFKIFEKKKTYLLGSSRAVIQRRSHPYIIPLHSGPSRAHFAKFKSLSSRQVQLWFDDGRDGILEGTLRAGQVVTTNAYEGHVFYVTYLGHKDEEVCRFTMVKSKVLYTIYDPKYPAPDNLLASDKREIAFMQEYLERTGVHWRHHYDPETGPRPPPVLNMWPANSIGEVRSIHTQSGKWNCSGPAGKCQGPAETLEIEVVSLQPRAFLVENIISEFEADEIVRMASSQLHRSSVGDGDAGTFESSTRTSMNTWLRRTQAAVTRTIYDRAADVLGLDVSLMQDDAHAELLQVVGYDKGQKYDAHHDWGVHGQPQSRFITLLLYLNTMDPDGGGETSFPKGANGTGFKVRPTKTTGVFFYNLLEDGNGDDLSLHASLPVIKGRKWLANFWVWDPRK